MSNILGYRMPIYVVKHYSVGVGKGVSGWC